MALSVVGLGAASASLLAGYVAGATTDEIYTFVCAKAYDIADPSNASYTFIQSGTSGSVASGVSTGSVKVASFWKIGASATGTGSNTFTATGQVASVTRTIRIATDAAPILVSTGVSLADTSESGTNVDATGSAASGEIRSGDMLLIAVGIKDDTPNHASQWLGVDGCTVGTITWAKSTNTTGDDIGVYIGYCLVTAGSSTGTVQYTATSDVSGASSTAVEIVVVRDSAVTTSEGSATIADTFAGSGAGMFLASSTGTITNAFTGSAAGRMVANATGVISTAFAGSAVGQMVAAGSAVLTNTFSVVGAGARAASGSASGATAFAVSAAGARVASASAAIAVAFATSAVGGVIRSGTASIANAFTGSASGQRASRAAASIANAFTTVANGAIVTSGTATGNTTWATAAIGRFTASGSAVIGAAWDGLASSLPQLFGAAVGAFQFATTAAGKISQSGTATTAVAWIGSSSGISAIGRAVFSFRFGSTTRGPQRDLFIVVSSPRGHLFAALGPHRSDPLDTHVTGPSGADITIDGPWS